MTKNGSINVAKLVHSEIQIMKKSKFQAHIMRISDKSDISQVLSTLKEDKSIRKATHPTMYAYIINENKIPEMGFNDCGESGAGTRILTLLQHMKLENVLLVVTRWYGGTPLGSARFRLITSVCMDALKKSKII